MKSLRFALVFLAMASPAWAGTMIESYGHFPPPGLMTFFHLSQPRNWVVDVFQNSLTVATTTDGGTFKVTPPGWEAHSGWFVFAEDTDLWAYDGAGKVIVEVLTPKNLNGYKFESRRNWARTWGAIPDPPHEVFDRLPPNIQVVIRQKFPTSH